MVLSYKILGGSLILILLWNTPILSQDFSNPPQSLPAHLVPHRGCVVQTPAETKLKDYAWQSIQPQSAPLLNELKVSFAHVFDFHDANPFPIVPNAEISPYTLMTISKILVLLFEFEGEKGPLHNQIPSPSFSDYRYLWAPDFSREHYQKMLFDRNIKDFSVSAPRVGDPRVSDPRDLSMADYYLETSSGRYTVTGDIYGWFKLPHAESYYGKDKPGGSSSGNEMDFDNANGPVWRIIKDAAPVMERENQINWSAYDTIDRYDWDQDGDVNEPDGYIDHLMIVHAGVGQEGGGDSDAMWSHRGRANYQTPNDPSRIDPTHGEPTRGGPTRGGPKKFSARGGIQVDSKHDLWILDYTILPENGAVGVFVHEFAHDLGLPDLYDTNPKNYSEASVAYWSVMASGGWGGMANHPAGTMPIHFSPWEKMRLGWLDYEEITLSDQDLHQFLILDRSEFHGNKAQSLKINLPIGEKRVEVAPPTEGRSYMYSDTGNDIDHYLTTEIDLSKTKSATLHFKAFYDIEVDYDYAYVEIEDDALWGNITTPTNPNGNNLGHGITGSSHGEWVNAVFDLTPYIGKKQHLRFRYVTDLAAEGKGIAIDDIRIPEIGFKDTFENEKEINPWKNHGFLKVNDGGIKKKFNHFYLVEWRTYYGFDRALNSIASSDPLKELTSYFAYQPGLVLWYRNEAYSEGDNQVGIHPGEGFLLVVDARSKPEGPLRSGLSPDAPYRTGLQIHDAAFGFEKSRQFHIFPGILGGTQAVSVFHDATSFYDDKAPYNSVKIPSYGLMFSLLNTSADRSAVQLALHYTSR